MHRYLQAVSRFSDERAEVPLPLETGRVPPDLEGVLYRNAPGRLVHHGVPYDHIFDGDGVVSRFLFENGRVTYTNRFVRTREWEAEDRAGRMLYRSFGTNLPGGLPANLFRMRFKNAANTNVLFRDGKLWALWEGGWPHRLDPVTLETLERDDLGGVLSNRFSPLERLAYPELPFSAHYRPDPRTGDLLFFGLYPGLQPRLLHYRWCATGPALSATELRRPVFVHDFVRTATGLTVFFLVPVSFDISRAFLGLCTPVESIRTTNGPTAILVLDDEGTARRFETDPFYVFHFAGGYVRGNDLVVDAMRMPEFPSADAVRRLVRGDVTADPGFGRATRYRIDLERETVRAECLSDFPIELPSVNPARSGRAYRYIWGFGGEPGSRGADMHSIVKIDTETGRTSHRDLYPYLPGEPLFVRRGGAGAEDSGWLLTLVFDPEQAVTKLVLLDAECLEPQAVLRLPHALPLGFHGQWVDAETAGCTSA